MINYQILFSFSFQIHFGSFASDESIFYRDIEFPRDHHAKVVHKKDKKDIHHHKNHVGSSTTHHKVDEQLLKFLFAKYVEIYKKEYLMSRYLNEVGVSSSSSPLGAATTTTTTQNVDRSVKKCEIRTEYYNDFDVCLKEYYSRSHTNLSSRCDDELRTKKTSDKKHKDRKLLGKQDYKRRSSWNEISKRETSKPEYYKVYTFSDETDTGGPQITSSYNKAKEDCDEDVATPTNAMSFVNEAGIDTTIVTFDRIVEIFPR